MGLLRRAGQAAGFQDKGLLKHGLLARGNVTGCERTAMVTGTSQQNVVCVVSVEIELEDRPTYTASCRHAIPREYLPQFDSGRASIAVRVDADDPQRIELDLRTDPPPARGGGGGRGAIGESGGPTASTTVIRDAADVPADVAAQLAASGVNLESGEVYDAALNRASPLSAAEIRATGTPCRVVIRSAQPLGMQKDGLDVWGLVLDVVLDEQPASQARIGTGVPSAAVALLQPGANLPAKHRPDVADGVTPDWDAALAEAAAR